MKRIMTTVAIFAFLASSSLLAERNGWSFALAGGSGSRTVEAGPDFTPFLFSTGSFAPTTTDQQTLLTLAQLEGIQGEEIETTEGHYRLMAEKQFGEGQNFSLNFGLSGVSATEKCSANCGDYLRAYLLNSLGTSTPNIFTFSLFSSALTDSGGFDYNYYTLDFGLNWHFMPKETFDPYIGLELGAGVCSVSGATSCTAARGMGKLGVRYYISNNFYVFVQGEYQSVTFSVTFADGSGVRIEPATNKVALFGLGYAL